MTIRDDDALAGEFGAILAEHKATTARRVTITFEMAQRIYTVLSTPTPTAQGETDEARLREVLAEEYDRHGYTEIARQIRSGVNTTERAAFAALRRVASPASQNVTISDEMVERAAAAMKAFVHVPLPNNTTPPTTIDLTRVSAGSLGDVWKLIAQAALTAALSPSQENT